MIHRTLPRAALAAALCLATPLALAQTDAGAVSDAGAPTDARPARPVADGDRCVADTLPPDHAPEITATIEPAQPKVGDRVMVRYHFRFRTRDRVEFDPDIVAFQQPAIEMDYARDQPERDRAAHSDQNGWLASDVFVAVQPFRVADVVIRALPARLSTADEISRVCTPEVRFRVRSVFGNDPHPAPRDVTPPADVHVDALTLRRVAIGLDAVFLIVMTTVLVTAWMRARPRKPVPPPPPRHPFLIASEGLDAIERSDLLARGLTKDYYDAISDVTRRYVGGMRSFDAIEMTTNEVLATLRKNPLQGVAMVEIEHLLGDCDLVKFARYVPSHEECDEVLKSARSIVDRGRPVVAPAHGASSPSARGKEGES